MLAAAFGVVNYLLLRLPPAIGILIVALLASIAIILLDITAPALDVRDEVRGIVLSVAFEARSLAVGLARIGRHLVARLIAVIVPTYRLKPFAGFENGIARVTTWGTASGAASPSPSSCRSPTARGSR